MTFQIKYINVFDDINSTNINDIQDFYSKANLRIEGRFQVPSYIEAEELQKSLDKIGTLNENSIAKHLESYSMLSKEVALTLSKNLLTELRLVVPSESALKSNYGKIAFWAKTVFNNVLNDTESNIFIELTPNKHETYMIYLASKLSNNIVLIDYSGKTEFKLYNNFIVNKSGTNEHLKPSMNIDIDIEKLSDILNGTLTINGAKILVIGEDKQFRLNTELVRLADNTPSNTILFKEGILKPTFDEVNKVPRPGATSIEALIKLVGNHMFMSKTEYCTKAASFIRRELQNETNVNKASSKLVSFICIYNRYKLDFTTVVFYGKIDNTVELYLKFLSDIDKTIVVIDTFGESKSIIDNTWINIKLSEPVNYHSYPEVAKSTTLAYNASKEIESTLYTGETLGLYRDRQYKTCDICTLNTTLDELLLLWKQDNTFKPSFNTSSNNVTVPVFYTKLSGVCKDYLNTLGKLVTDHSIICYNHSEIVANRLNNMVINHFACINNTLFKDQKPMYKNGTLDISTIMNYTTFTYKHLDIGVQQHILSKLNLIITENWIKHTGITNEEYIDIVLNVGLNLSKRIQQEMQWYDYTKQSPKMVILLQDEEILTIEESITITLLHLCGWDIVIAVPTCYNVLGDSLRNEGLQEHIIGEPKFNLNIQQLNNINNTEEKKKGFFSRLFN